MAYTGPGDIVSGASFWGGLRAYSSVQANGTTNIIQVRRSSDNTTQNIVALTTGALDVATATSFAGGSNLFVSIIYDQSGNGLDLSGGGAGSESQLFLTGGTLTSLPWMNAAFSYVQGSFPVLSQPVSMSNVAIRTGNFTTRSGIMTTYVSGGAYTAFDSSANTLQNYAGNVVTVGSVADNAWHRIQSVFNGASSNIYADGTANTVNAGTLGTNGQLLINVVDNVHDSPLTGGWVEGGVWNTAFTTSGGGQAAQIDANQNAYWFTASGSTTQTFYFNNIF